MPYKGGMQAVTDMLGGTIHVNIGTTSTLLPLIREGKMRAIAQSGRKSASRSAGRADHDRKRLSGSVARLLGRAVGAGRHARRDRATS